MDPITAGALIAVGGTYLLSYFGKKGGGSMKNEILPSFLTKLSANQIYMAYLIEVEFIKAGLPFSIACAAVINAYAESKLNPNAAGDCGGGRCRSIGLFQLHEAGAGAGMTVEERKNPIVNIQTIINREVKTARGKALRQRAAEGATVAELAAIFSRDIERPKDKQGNMDARYALGEKMFGQGKAYAAEV